MIKILNVMNNKHNMVYKLQFQSNRAIITQIPKQIHGRLTLTQRAERPDLK